MISSISISDFDNSFTDNCLPVHQTNDCSRLGNLGHLRRKPTEWIFLDTTHRHLSLCHLHVEIWLSEREMYIPRGPIDMTQKITHSLGDIFRSVLLCWAKHRDFWVIAHLNNAKCVRLHTPEASDAKWLGWQGTDDEMFCHKRVSMFPFPHCVLAVSERGVEEVCTCHRNRGEKSRPLKV